MVLKALEKCPVSVCSASNCSPGPKSSSQKPFSYYKNMDGDIFENWKTVIDVLEPSHCRSLSIFPGIFIQKGDFDIGFLRVIQYIYKVAINDKLLDLIA